LMAGLGGPARTVPVAAMVVAAAAAAEVRAAEADAYAAATAVESASAIAAPAGEEEQAWPTLAEHVARRKAEAAAAEACVKAEAQAAKAEEEAPTPTRANLPPQAWKSAPPPPILLPPPQPGVPEAGEFLRRRETCPRAYEGTMLSPWFPWRVIDNKHSTNVLSSLPPHP